MKGKGKEGKRETLEVLKNGGEAEVFVVRNGWVLVEICSSSHLFPPQYTHTLGTIRRMKMRETVYVFLFYNYYFIIILFIWIVEGRS